MAKPGLALIFGKDKGKDEPEVDDSPMEEEGELSEAARSAWEEYDAAPSAEGFARAVKACMGDY